jgi:hypothetical protein
MATKMQAQVAHKVHVEARKAHVGQAHRAVTFTDRKKAASKNACRGRVTW